LNSQARCAIKNSVERKGNGPQRRGALVPPLPSSPQISAAMRGNKSKDTLPELLLRRALWNAGIRGYRKNEKGLPGNPDLVLSRFRLTIFVHGCFWHHCPRCNIPIPRKNTSYWQEKIRRNIERDSLVFNKLKRAGWRVMRFWECDIHRSISNCVSRISQRLQASN
jgi:DNA mismatch endonuclease (patch repair protein)